MKNNTNTEKPIKIDLVDRKILYLLSRNCRFSNSTLGKHLHLSREKIAYRIKRLESSRILQKFSLWINPQKIGWYALTIGIKIKVTLNVEKVLQDLQKIPRITSLHHCGGLYDILFNIMGETIEEAYNVMQTVLEKFGEEINKYYVLTKINQQYFGLKYLIPEEKERLILDHISQKKGSAFAEDFSKAMARIKNNNKKSEKINIDPIENEIINILHKEARITIQELSIKSSISSFLLKQKLRFLIQTDILNGFIINIDSKSTNLSPYFVFLTVRKDKEIAFQTWVAKHPSITWCTNYLGEHNYKLNLFAKNNAEVSKILASLCQEFGSSISKVEYVSIFQEITCNWHNNSN